MADPKGRTRIILLGGIALVVLATVVVQQRFSAHKAERAAGANDPAAQARAALGEADQAVIEKDLPALQASLIRARDALDLAMGERPEDRGLARSRLVVSRRLANVAAERGESALARAALEDAFSRAQALFAADRTGERARTDLLNAARELAAQRLAAGEAAAAARVLEKAADDVKGALGVLPGGGEVLFLLAHARLDAAEAHAEAKATAEATAALTAAAAQADAARVLSDPAQGLAEAYAVAARAASIAEAARLPDALGRLRGAVDLLEKRLAVAPDNLALARSLAAWNARLGDRLEAAGDDEAASGAHRRALALRKTIVDTQPADQDARRALVRSTNRLGAWASARGQNSEALALYRQAVQEAAPLGDDRTRLVALGNLAHLQGRMDQMVESKATAALAYAVALRLTARSPKDERGMLDAATAGLRRARLLRAEPAPDRGAALKVVEAEQARLARFPGRAHKKLRALKKGLADLHAELSP